MLALFNALFFVSKIKVFHCTLSRKGAPFFQMQSRNTAGAQKLRTCVSIHRVWPMWPSRAEESVSTVLLRSRGSLRRERETLKRDVYTGLRFASPRLSASLEVPQDSLGLRAACLLSRLQVLASSSMYYSKCNSSF